LAHTIKYSVCVLAGLLLACCASGQGGLGGFPTAKAKVDVIQDLIPLEEFKTLYIVDFDPPDRGGVHPGIVRRLSQWLAFYCREKGFETVEQVRRENAGPAPGRLVLSGQIKEAFVPKFPPSIGDRTRLRLVARFVDPSDGRVLGELEIVTDGYLREYPRYGFESETREAAKTIADYMSQFMFAE